MDLRIATWNMNHCQQGPTAREEAWAYLAREVEPDIALLQETIHPPEQENVLSRVGGIGTRRPWGSAVAAYGRPITELTSVQSPYSSQHVSILQTHPGCVVVAQTPFPDGSPLTTISVYGLIDAGYAQTMMLRVLSDLTPLFNTAP
jgi:hypothetical protein